jgi:hypothetical protein
VMLVIAQLGLGAATWIYKYNFPAFMGGSEAASAFTVHAMDWRQAQITTAHVATGSLILAMSTVLALRTTRLFWTLGLEHVADAASVRSVLPVNDANCVAHGRAEAAV